MLTRCLRAAKVLNQNAPVFLRAFASVQGKKDYYDILGVTKDATVDEIKEAYRKLAKKYHPDVNASGEINESDAEKFRDVVEAYQVLSVLESRTAYDIANKSTPDLIYRAQRMEYQRKYAERGRDGNPTKEAFQAGSYAEFKRNWLAEERKKFNVNSFGRYKGGVPQKGKKDIRGKSMGPPGGYHDPLYHNMKINPRPADQFITGADALAFKNYMVEDQYGLQRRGTWFQASVDYDFLKFETYRYGWRWIRNLILLTSGFAIVYELAYKAKNRSILKQFEQLTAEAKVSEGVKIDGRTVVQTESGIIKYKDEVAGHHKHH